MSNPSPKYTKYPWYNNSYQHYKQDYIYPNNLDVISWPAGYGDDLTDTYPGVLGSIPASVINSFRANFVSGTIDLLPILGQVPMTFPYKNWRNLAVSFTDSSWETENLLLFIEGTTSNLEEGDETLSLVPLDTAIVSDTIWVDIKHIYLAGTFTGDVTSGINFDLGYLGQTAPFTPDPKCSSWTASLQVLPSGNISYKPYNDNFPRNVQSNQRPSVASPWFSTFVGSDAISAPFEMLDYTEAQPYPAIGVVNSTAIIKPVPFPVQNVYLTITDNNTDSTGSLTAIFLQDSIWFR